ncbi:unnamed protein product, partial [Rotaria sp. Silwood1]
IYNPPTTVIYSNTNRTDSRIRLIDYIQNTGANIDEISTDNVLNYVNDRYLTNEDFFINKYQVAFAAYNNLSTLSVEISSIFAPVF